MPVPRLARDETEVIRIETPLPAVRFVVSQPSEFSRLFRTPVLALSEAHEV